jgi:hypothetical protein
MRILVAELNVGDYVPAAGLVTATEFINSENVQVTFATGLVAIWSIYTWIKADQFDFSMI